MDGPRSRNRCAKVVRGAVSYLDRGIVRENVAAVGLDVAKNVFQVHGDGGTVVRRRLRRAAVLSFFGSAECGPSKPSIRTTYAARTAHFGPFSVSVRRVSLKHPNHARFGTDVRTTPVQWVRWTAMKRGFERATLRRSKRGSNRSVRYESRERTWQRPPMPGYPLERPAGALRTPFISLATGEALLDQDAVSNSKIEMKLIAHTFLDLFIAGKRSAGTAQTSLPCPELA